MDGNTFHAFFMPNRDERKFASIFVLRFLTPAGFGMTMAKRGNNVARLDDNGQLLDAEVPRQSNKKQMTLSFRAKRGNPFGWERENWGRQV